MDILRDFCSTKRNTKQREEKGKVNWPEFNWSLPDLRRCASGRSMKVAFPCKRQLLQTHPWTGVSTWQEVSRSRQRRRQCSWSVCGGVRQWTGLCTGPTYRRGHSASLLPRCVWSDMPLSPRSWRSLEIIRGKGGNTGDNEKPKYRRKLIRGSNSFQSIFFSFRKWHLPEITSWEHGASTHSARPGPEEVEHHRTLKQEEEETQQQADRKEP